MSLRLTVLNEDKAGEPREAVYDQEVVSIGRDAKNTVRLADATEAISRFHAQILRRGETFVVVDLHSRNFTYLNGKRLTGGEEAEVRSGDSIRLCDVEIRVVFEKGVSPGIDSPAVAGGNGEPAGTVAPTAALDEAGRTVDAQVRPENELLPAVVDLLLDLLAKLSKAYREFRSEFVGETIVRSSKTLSAQFCSEDDLRRFIASPCRDRAEARERVELIRTIAEEIMLHQLSLLDGYKESVAQGTMKLLERLDPAALQLRLDGKKSPEGSLKIPRRGLSVGKHQKFVQAIAEIHRELAEEDQATIECKVFRPAFIRGYTKRMNAFRNRELESRRRRVERSG